MIGRQEDSFLSLEDDHHHQHHQHHNNHNEYVTADTSIASMGERDTSNTCRNISLDNTRDDGGGGRNTSTTSNSFMSMSNTRDNMLCSTNTSSSSTRDRHNTTVNTHNSILDLTKDEEEDEEDDDDDEFNTSVLFDDLQIYSSMGVVEEEEDNDHHHGNIRNNDVNDVAFAAANPSSSFVPKGTGSGSPVDPRNPQEKLQLQLQQQQQQQQGQSDPSCRNNGGAAANNASSQSKWGKFSLNTVTDSFVDSFCPAEMPSVATSCTSSSSRGGQHGGSVGGFGVGGCGSPCVTPCSPHSMMMSSNGDGMTSMSCYPEQRIQTSMDVWNLLSCNAAPGTDEKDSIWSIRTTQVIQRSRRPARVPMKERLKRIHRLRMERVSGPSRHGVTITPHIERAQTMVDNIGGQKTADPLATHIGFGMDPIPHINNDDDDVDNINNNNATTNIEDGYDSDPGVNASYHARSPQTTTHGTTSKLDPYDDGCTGDDDEDIAEQDNMILETVQQTLNSTWTLTWHPNPANVEEFQIPSKPMCLNIWMERGTVITSTGVVLEPSIMWRDAFQAELGKHKLNASTQAPWSMRLLNTCRISACSPESIDRSKYPFARPSRCLVLRTCNDQEFLLEASTSEERDQVCERWKLVVARFASLAVIEDIDAIAREYFHPTLNSQMLTIET